MSPRWRKLVRDVWMERGRVALMVVAVAVSVTGIGTVLGSYAILSREMPRNYATTSPASATLELEGDVDQNLLDEVRRRPDIADADAGDIVLARARVGEDWIPLLLFVVDDFENLRLNAFARVSGAWPPPPGSMLVERSAVRVLDAGQGAWVLVKARGAPRSLTITGLVHDPGLAPAWQEQQGYGYVTRETLALLGMEPELHELRIATRARPLDASAVETTSAELARYLSLRGHHVGRIRVPPPGRHPHETQMEGVMFLLVTFGALVVLLSGVLVAASLSAMMSRQVREIGVMKTSGARAIQIAALYAVLVLALGVVAVALANPAGALGAVALAEMSGRMLNLTLESTEIPHWVFAVQAAAGVLVPFLVALIPISLGARATVRDAIDRHGAGQPGPASRLAWIEGSRWFGRTGVLAVRNAFRRRTRLFLSVALLAAGGAMFIAAIDVSRGWERIVGRVYENRSYDVEVRLHAPASLAEGVRRVPGVRSVEAWGFGRAAVFREGQIDVVRTYPDGGHGSLSMLGPPPQTELVRFPILSGRWLRSDDTDGVVLNHLAAAQLPGATVGSVVILSLEGKPASWRVVGIVEEVGSPAAAYVTDRAFARVAGTGNGTRMLRIATTATSPDARDGVIRALEHHLEREGADLESVIPLSVLRTAMGDHVVVLIRLLLAMAALMVTVAVLGLFSTLGTNVLERTREIGVMKTMGATGRQIAGLVIAEALVIAALSWAFALALALPLTAVVGRTVGVLAFRVRLPFVVDPAAVSIWLALVLGFAALAALLPARRASRLTVREALAEV
jgi:putative ABC transport system permease protein